MEGVFETKTFGKATVYWLSEFGFGYNKTEVREGRVERGKYAQYDAAVRVTFKRPGDRKERSITDASHDGLRTVILEGWGHPDPANWLGKPDADGSAMSRHSSFAPEWKDEFNRLMDAYLATGKPVKVADYRGMSASDRTRLGWFPKYDSK